METNRSALVAIAREFLLAYRRTREIAALHRSGELSFDLVRGWVGDDDSSALFRLKQRCHASFRDDDHAHDEGEVADDAIERHALFDLTVGALFHEAMRYRENFYQREIYGPRVRKLKGGSEEELGLMREFDRILGGASGRLDEALLETETLLEQARRQFLGLLRERARDGLVARQLIESAGYVALVFEGGLAGLLAEVYGGVAEGHALAARSYLDSGHFAEASAMLEKAVQQGGEQASWKRLLDYSAAMTAYLAGSYGDATEGLGRWLDQGPAADEKPYAALALDAVSHLGKLVRPEERARVAKVAEGLTARLQSVVGV